MTPSAIPSATQTYTISKAKSDQSTLLCDGEYCTLRRDIAQEIGSFPGEQVRLKPEGDEGRSAAFTVHDIHDSDAEIRIARNGRERLALNASAAVRASSIVPVHELTRMEAFESNNVTETLWDTGQESVLVCAPHDGFESNTAQAAGIVRKRIGDERASAWFVHAFGPDAFDRFHITSANISPASYPGLATVADRGFDYCISFHVFRGDDVLVGGLADKTLRDELGERISEAINGKRHVETERSEMRYAGKTQENIVNRLTTDSESGIQIEMPALIAHRYRKRVARTVADFFDERLSSSGEGKHD